MYAKARNQPQASSVLLLLVALALAGCSHSVLNFIFTGVPEPGEVRTVDDGAPEPLPSRSDDTRRTPNFVLQIPDYVHGPFGAVACNLCHLDESQRTVGGTAVRSTPRPGQQLAFPIETLCVGCHSEKAAAEVVADGLWQHGPVANGWCTGCHSPHKTRRQYMLLQENDVAMCGQCHSPNALRHTPQHAANPGAECTDCHNPHAGRNRLLLRAEYDERMRFGGS